MALLLISANSLSSPLFPRQGIRPSLILFNTSKSDRLFKSRQAQSRLGGIVATVLLKMLSATSGKAGGLR